MAVLEQVYEPGLTDEPAGQTADEKAQVIHAIAANLGIAFKYYEPSLLELGKLVEMVPHIDEATASKVEKALIKALNDYLRKRRNRAFKDWYESLSPGLPPYGGNLEAQN